MSVGRTSAPAGTRARRGQVRAAAGQLHAVTRMLKDLERQGLVKIEGREIVLQPGFEKAFD